MAPSEIPENTKSGVYLIKNTTNGKVYVGSSENITNRWNGHRCLLRKGNHRNPHLQVSWNKHGEAAFEFSVLLFCEIDDLIQCEQIEIDRLMATDRRHGYNINPIAGRSSGRKTTEETRRKISTNRKGKGCGKRKPMSDVHRMKLSIANTGKKYSDETKQKHREAMKNRSRSEVERIASLNRGRKRSAETRAVMSAIARSRTPEHLLKIGHALRGRPLSEEHKAKLSAAHSGKKLSEQHRQSLSNAQRARRDRERNGNAQVR